MYIRSVSNENEVRQAYTLEEASYPSEAAASQDAFLERFRVFPSYFLVAEEDQTLHGVANGVRLVHDDLSGEGMKQMTDYDAQGMYFCLLTVAVRPESRGQGIGRKLLQAIVKQAQQDRLRAVILLCEEHLVPFYKQEGFDYVRPSSSLHGGIAWHEMRLQLEPHTR